MDRYCESDCITYYDSCDNVCLNCMEFVADNCHFWDFDWENSDDWKEDNIKSNDMDDIQQKMGMFYHLCKYMHSILY